MITAAVILNAILGGLWRRVLGGWGGFRRSYIVASGALLGWPLWFTLPWWGAILATAAMLLFFTMGHRFDNWTIVLRYPLAGAAYPIFRKLGLRKWAESAEFVIGGFYWGCAAALLGIAG